MYIPISAWYSVWRDHIPVGYKWNWWNFGWLENSIFHHRRPLLLSHHPLSNIKHRNERVMWWMFGKLSNSRQKSHNCAKSSIVTVSSTFRTKWDRSMEHVQQVAMIKSKSVWCWNVRPGQIGVGTLPPAPSPHRNEKGRDSETIGTFSRIPSTWINTPRAPKWAIASERAEAELNCWIN